MDVLCHVTSSHNGQYWIDLLRNAVEVRIKCLSSSLASATGAMALCSKPLDGVVCFLELSFLGLDSR